MARSRVVLPLPEGPTSASSSPAAQWNSAASGMGPAWWRLTARLADETRGSATTPPPPARQAVDHADGEEGSQQQHCRHGGRAALVEGLHPIVDGDGQGAGLAVDGATHHQDHPELPQGEI